MLHLLNPEPIYSHYKAGDRIVMTVERGQKIVHTQVLRRAGAEPQYLKRSFNTFSFGVKEARVFLKSVNMTPRVTFEPSMSTQLSKIVSTKTVGAIAAQEGRINCVLAVCETMFLMALGCQVVVEKHNDIVMSGIDCYLGDLVTGLRMIDEGFSRLVRSEYSDLI